MKINYFFDEKIEFFESLLTKNEYWDFLAKKFYGKNLMNHPYKKNIIMFFENYKEDVVFTYLDKFCKSISDFSLLLEFPFCYKIENETLCINQNNKKTFTTNSNNNIECYDFLNKISDLYKKSNYKDFFTSLDKKQFELPEENKKNIYLRLENLQNYINSTIPNINLHISPLIMGNFFITSKNDGINIAISPVDYKDKYIWGTPEDYITNLVINCFTKKIISNLTTKNKTETTLPYYQDENTKKSFLLSKIIDIRLKIKYENKNEKQLLENEKINFPDIETIYKKLVTSEQNEKFDFAKVSEIL